MTARDEIDIEDFKDASFSDFGQLNRQEMKEVMTSVQVRREDGPALARAEREQNCVPLRIRAIYILNAPWYIRFLFALVKPFMKKKMGERVWSSLAHAGRF